MQPNEIYNYRTNQIRDYPKDDIALTSLGSNRPTVSYVIQHALLKSFYYIFILGAQTLSIQK